MTSSDLRDVLNLGDSSSDPRPSKKQKTGQPKPNLKGLAREVLNLGGDNPVSIIPAKNQFKKRRLGGRKPAARWELREFRNSGRDDGSLILRHWRRVGIKDSAAAGGENQKQPEAQSPGGGQSQARGPEQHADKNQGEAERDMEDSAFAKFNVRIQVPQYSQDQYRVSLQSEDWTREETDYLMGMASDFDLRWPLIWDRYEYQPPATNGVADADGDENKAIVPATRPRSMEDLKARYYEVAAKMMAAQKPVQYMTQQEYALHETMAHFNPKQEKLRKEFAVNSMSRSKEEAREEESLLLEVKRIMARSERFNEERRELYNRLDYPKAETDINPFKSSAGLQTLLQNLMSTDKSKKRKSIVGIETTAGAGPGAAGAAQNLPGPESGRRESAALSNAATRESTAATPTPTAASKKAQQLQERQQQQPTERRKLNHQEEAVYGVTHHDRLGSGPVFRTEKINKLFSHKSNQQQLRISNALNELDVPAKLAMPTAATTLQYEQLLAAVNSLLDARKVSDKLDGEIKIEQAKKAEREKNQGPAASQKETAPADSEQKAGGEGKKPDDSVASRDEREPGDKAAGQTGGNKADDAKDQREPPPAGADDAAEASTSKPGQDEEAAAPAEKLAEAEREREREKSARPASSNGPHKRSASVLSSVSDKSAKRQKK
ncbi:SWR1-complex protein 4 [Metarhizium album ARSEF 1941]|uniref:SWR1-complex protein 4 n=1 Tax=Metarhizium album (strain ARSEF 1941) TaxID=1081103 RepID=A0A0B2WU01_METAS|nr:SWR1-complex protein 4 [Metarhizium album ARSEF 1941]KHN96942.1 SWR1-complex protein 4 [Metarhizium album ARSEF 1941]